MDYNRDPSGTAGDALFSALRLDSVVALPSGPFAQAGASSRTEQRRGRVHYPKHYGFDCDTVTKRPIYERLSQFPAGAAFDRFGSPNGYFLGADHDMFPTRSVPPESAAEEYYRYIVGQPLPANLAVLMGEIEEAFAAPGGGTQYMVIRIDTTTGLPTLRRSTDYADITNYFRLTIEQMMDADIIELVYPRATP
ncbi:MULTISPECIES: TNT domain-containing protein [Rhodococcus]|uniref:TNT domain-containing protein n=1 Tax=Nocardiaceae TaxID=85025 RepID=UPI00056CC1B8|nr:MULTISPECIES: TNT domain-containing protein [Rhodococcus]